MNIYKNLIFSREHLRNPKRSATTRIKIARKEAAEARFNANTANAIVLSTKPNTPLYYSLSFDAANAELTVTLSIVKIIEIISALAKANYAKAKKVLAITYPYTLKYDETIVLVKNAHTSVYNFDRATTTAIKEFYESSLVVVKAATIYAESINTDAAKDKVNKAEFASYYAKICLDAAYEQSFEESLEDIYTIYDTTDITTNYTLFAWAACEAATGV